MSKKSLLIENKQDLISFISNGCKPKEQWRIGTEHEKFGYCLNKLTPLPYEGKYGIQKLLNNLKDNFNWIPVVENGKLIGLDTSKFNKKHEISSSITLEPGGQFELSGAPLDTVHETYDEVYNHLLHIKAVNEGNEQAFIGIGFAPTWKIENISVVPKDRYKIMSEYMKTIGSLGYEMMFLSATVQVNLDYSSESDMLKKIRVSLALQPIVTALFANSPFKNGKPNGFLSYRSEVWRHTDINRTGMLPFMFDDGADFESYVDHALDVPMYFVCRNSQYIDVTGESFRDFLKGKLKSLPNEKPTIKDWENHLSTLFPEVRMKQFLEMRGADASSWQNLCALPAFFVGLLYDDSALDQAYELIKDWSIEEILTIRNIVPKSALQTPFRNGTLQDIAKEAVKIACQGLSARNMLDKNGRNEEYFINNIIEIAETGVTNAQILLNKYHGEWGGDINHIFKEYSY